MGRSDCMSDRADFCYDFGSASRAETDIRMGRFSRNSHRQNFKGGRENEKRKDRDFGSNHSIRMEHVSESKKYRRQSWMSG